MAKASGNTRILTSASGTRLEKYKVYLRELSQADVDKSLSYYSKKKGGYVIGMRGRKHDDTESEAAKAMADDGLIVVLTPEGGVKFRTGRSRRTSAYVYADGLVNGYTYEQQTKKPQSLDPDNLKNAVDNALQHAQLKNAQIPLIYDRYGLFHKEHIEVGLEQFEEHSPFKFKTTVVMDKDGNVFEHHHNKK